ncbi:Pecanex-like protein 4, partial [Nowakowskiella sp. JEL0078]
ITNISIGDMFLARIENSRILIFHVIEKWFDGVKVTIKGLELQGTSCHALEATRIDDIFTNTFPEVRESCNIVNRNWVSILEPLASFENVHIFSDTNISLIGIFDHPENIDRLLVVVLN